jgi:hypothetical protein
LNGGKKREGEGEGEERETEGGRKGDYSLGWARPRGGGRYGGGVPGDGGQVGPGEADGIEGVEVVAQSCPRQAEERLKRAEGQGRDNS